MRETGSVSVWERGGGLVSEDRVVVWVVDVLYSGLSGWFGSRRCRH